MKPDHQAVEAMRDAFIANLGVAAGVEDAQVSADEMWDVIIGDTRGDDARAVIARVCASPQAQLEWRIAVELVRESGLAVVVAEADDSAPVRDELAERRSRKAYWATCVGASLAAAAIAFLVLRPKLDETHVPPTIRVMPRSSVESALPPGPISLDRDLVLKWTGGPAKARYDVRVTAESLQVIDAGFNLEKREFTVGVAKLRGLAGTAIYWRVVATSSEGERIESPSFTIRIAR